MPPYPTKSHRMDLAKFSLVGLKGESMHSGPEMLSEFQTHYSHTWDLRPDS